MSLKMWKIWRMRNVKVFEEGAQIFLELVNSILHEVDKRQLAAPRYLDDCRCMLG
jgi:hypothetical protein